MEPSVPNDFPRGITAATLPGSQLKFVARQIDGRYVVGVTQEELHARWLYCEDLAQQLAQRTLHKQREGLVTDLAAFYADTERRARGQGWAVTQAELDWIIQRMKTLGSAP